MCTDLGASNHYKLDHLQQPDVWKYVEGADLFYVGGFHLTVCPPAADALGKEAASKNKTFALGLSAPFIPVAFKDQLNMLLPYADFVIGNESEAAAFAEANGLGAEYAKDIPAIARYIALTPKTNQVRPRTVIITQGTDPTIVATTKGDGVGEVQMLTIPIHAIDKSQINDTNGAGDAFAGGFLAGIVEGKDLRTSVDMGQWLARLGLQELGPS